MFAYVWIGKVLVQKSVKGCCRDQLIKYFRKRTNHVHLYNFLQSLNTGHYVYSSGFNEVLILSYLSQLTANYFTAIYVVLRRYEI